MITSFAILSPSRGSVPVQATAAYSTYILFDSRPHYIHTPIARKNINRLLDPNNIFRRLSVLALRSPSRGDGTEITAASALAQSTTLLRRHVGSHVISSAGNIKSAIMILSPSRGDGTLSARVHGHCVRRSDPLHTCHEGRQVCRQWRWKHQQTCGSPGHPPRVSTPPRMALVPRRKNETLATVKQKGHCEVGDPQSARTFNL